MEVKMVKGVDKKVVLKLMCLLSILHSGIKKEDLHTLIKSYIFCYGWDEMPTLMNLQDAGILRVRDSKFSFEKVRKALNLIPEVPEGEEMSRELKPVDISYTYDG